MKDMRFKSLRQLLTWHQASPNKRLRIIALSVLGFIILGCVIYMATGPYRTDDPEVITARKELPALKKEVKQDPNNTKSLLELADAAYLLKQYKLAEASYTKLLEKEPNNSAAQTGLANTRRHTASKDEQFTAAESLYKEAIKTGPGNVTPYIGYAELLLEAGKKDVAKVIIEEGLKYNPDSQALQELQKQVTK